MIKSKIRRAWRNICSAWRDLLFEIELIKIRGIRRTWKNFKKYIASKIFKTVKTVLKICIFVVKVLGICIFAIIELITIIVGKGWPKITYETKVNTYRALKGNSISPTFYLYMGHYNVGRILGNILTLLVITSSIVIGKITGSIVVDTICYAVSIGSLIYNYKIINVLYKGKKTGYLWDDEDDWESEYSYNLRVFLLPMIMLSRFTELYTVFIAALAIPDMIMKLSVCFLIIMATILFKLKNNLIENKVSSIIMKNSICQIIVVLAGLFISQKETVMIYGNNILLTIAFIVGIGRYALAKNLRKFFKEELECIKNKEHSMYFPGIRDIFNQRILSKTQAEKAVKEEAEKREAARKKEQEEANEKAGKILEEQRRQQEAARKKKQQELWRYVHNRYDNWENNESMDEIIASLDPWDQATLLGDKYEEWEKEQKKKKEQAEKDYRNIEKKINQSEGLSKEEKKIVKDTVENSGLIQNTDRTKIKR